MATETEGAGAAPRVSIGMPVYNGADYLAGAIESVLNQSFRDFELIISDNASTDGTQEICERYAAQDPRIRYSRLETNVGAAPNYNRLVEMARGELFKWQAHDDLCEPAFLEKCVEALDANPEAVLCYPSTYVIDGEGEVMRTYRDGLDLPQKAPHQRFITYLRRNFMRKKGLCNPIFGLIRMSALKRTRLIQSFLSSDRSLIGHFSLLGQIIELPEVLFQRRVHEGISTMADTRLQARRAWFDTSAIKKSRGALTRLVKDNRFSLRFEQFGDYYRAISELVDDEAERKRCRRALSWLIVSDPKWIYIDLKYSLGYTPSNATVMKNLRSQS